MEKGKVTEIHTHIRTHTRVIAEGVMGMFINTPRDLGQIRCLGFSFPNCKGKRLDFLILKIVFSPEILSGTDDLYITRGVGRRSGFGALGSGPWTSA